MIEALKDLNGILTFIAFIVFEAHCYSSETSTG